MAIIDGWTLPWPEICLPLYRAGQVRAWELAAGFSFLFRRPDTGRSRAGWSLGRAALVPLSCRTLLPFAADASWARPRFRAAMRSITGGSAEISLGLCALLR